MSMANAVECLSYPATYFSHANECVKKINGEF